MGSAYTTGNLSVYRTSAPNDGNSENQPATGRSAAPKQDRLRSNELFAYHDVGTWANCVRAVALSIECATAWSDSALWRRVLSALLLLSFCWMSYLSQTHIHARPLAPSAAAPAIAKSFHIEAPVKAPVNQDSDGSASCPMCQAVSLGGAAILPLLVAFLVLQLTVQHVLPGPAKKGRASHFDPGHQTRGPPIL